MNRKAMSLVAAVVTTSCGSTAFGGSLNAFDWNTSTGGAWATNNSAGAFESVAGMYNSSDQTFSWEVVFSDQITNAITLAVSPGPNPKGIPNELAFFYFSDGLNQPEGMTLNVYSYNGKDGNSYRDGDATVGGDQTPDLIHSSEIDDSWIFDMNIYDDGAKRVFTFTVDASTINWHNPLYGSQDDWTGVRFDDSIGIWLHSWANNGSPGAIHAEGVLEDWNYYGHGWLDGNELPAEVTIVPLPPAAGLGLAGLCGVAVARRRRMNRSA